MLSARPRRRLRLTVRLSATVPLRRKPRLRRLFTLTTESWLIERAGLSSSLHSMMR